MSDPVKLRNDRLIAAIIDGIIFGVVVSFPLSLIGQAIPVVGPLIAGLLAAAAYCLKDALPIAALDGASPGKKIMGIKAVKSDGSNVDYETSIKRNIPFAVGNVISAVLGVVPVLGAIVALLVAFPLQIGILCYETYLIFKKPNGERWGDSFAGTQVVRAGQTANVSAENFPPPPPSAEQTAPPPPLPNAEAPAQPAGNPAMEEDTRH